MVDRTLHVAVTTAVGSFQLDVDFTVEPGLTVLFGPSGSGKSTLLDCLAGLRVPDKGRIVVHGQIFLDKARGINLPPQKRHLGYVFQESALFPHLSVRDNITFGIDRWPRERKESRTKYLCELLKLDGLLDRRPSQLSGGEAQRVALARAIAPEPRLLLLDEPFSSLDMRLRAQLGSELSAIRRELSLPMVLVTHFPDEALELGDTVVSLAGGRVCAVGSPPEILGNV